MRGGANSKRKLRLSSGRPKRICQGIRECIGPLPPSFREMTEESVKKRFRRAVISAEKLLSLPSGNSRVIRFGNGPFDLESIRKKEIRTIRIVLGEIKESDRGLLRDFEMPEICTKEIWNRKLDGSFEIEIIKD